MKNQLVFPWVTLFVWLCPMGQSSFWPADEYRRYEYAPKPWYQDWLLDRYKVSPISPLGRYTYWHRRDYPTGAIDQIDNNDKDYIDASVSGYGDGSDVDGSGYDDYSDVIGSGSFEVSDVINTDTDDSESYSNQESTEFHFQDESTTPDTEILGSTSQTEAADVLTDVNIEHGEIQDSSSTTGYDEATVTVAKSLVTSHPNSKELEVDDAVSKADVPHVAVEDHPNRKQLDDRVETATEAPSISLGVGLEQTAGKTGHDVDAPDMTQAEMSKSTTIEEVGPLIGMIGGIVLGLACLIILVVVVAKHFKSKKEYDVLHVQKELYV